MGGSASSRQRIRSRLPGPGAPGIGASSLPRGLWAPGGPSRVVGGVWKESGPAPLEFLPLTGPPSGRTSPLWSQVGLSRCFGLVSLHLEGSQGQQNPKQRLSRVWDLSTGWKIPRFGAFPVMGSGFSPSFFHSSSSTGIGIGIGIGVGIRIGVGVGLCCCSRTPLFPLAHPNSSSPCSGSHPASGIPPWDPPHPPNPPVPPLKPFLNPTPGAPSGFQPSLSGPGCVCAAREAQGGLRALLGDPWRVCRRCGVPGRAQELGPCVE